MRGTQFLREEGSFLLFGNARITLRFEKATGKLTDFTADGMTFAKADLPDLMLCLGGHTVSSLDPDKLNVQWARMLYRDTTVRGADAKLSGYCTRQTAEGTQLRLATAFAGFEATAVYTIGEGAEFTRTFELTSLSDEPVRLRGTAAYLPASGALCHMECPGWSIPDTTVLTAEADWPLAENLYDLTPGKEGPGGGNVLLLHDGKRVLSLVNESLRENANGLGLVRAGEGFAIRQSEKTCAILEKDETITLGTLRVRLSEGDWRDEVYAIGRSLETLGCRVNPGTSRESLKDLAIYETQIGTLQFRTEKSHYPTLQDLIDDLPRLRDLGYNCLQLMPSFPFPGYSIYDLHRPEWQHAYGADLRPLVKKAHALGIKVILDVLMHGVIDKEVARWNQKTYVSRKVYYPEWEKCSEYEVCPLRREHPDWFIHDDDGDIFRVYTWSFDWANPGVQDYLADALAMYVTDLDVDGFRFDAPTWVGAPNWAEGNPRRADHSLIAGVRETFDRARVKVDRLKKGVIWYTEPENIYLRSSMDLSYAYSTMGLWRPLFEGKITGAQMQEWLAVRKRINPVGSLYSNWMDNHDSWTNGTTEEGMYSYERFSPTFARSLLALALFQEGAYMAYSGSELLDPEYYRRLLGLRRNNPIFRDGDCSFEAVHAEDPALVSIYWTLGAEKLIAVVNTADHPVESALSGAPEGEYTDLCEGKPWRAGQPLLLAPGGCALLRADSGR